jgi:hypothetical protein
MKLIPTNILVYYSLDKFFLLGLLAREGGTDTLPRNVGKQLPHDAA